ncbi:RdRP-domain-containing protein [Patellaria atrata CBS 101060]|uniref:RNA-dependent RNA polymerase n=1 Tax=Patellaria atrata CBS 101060 TaxID=1346257 RepID=A0A9P4SIW2_9PEZI|nr:RdRP-domain-containing protein [Patellaria atrata CBS 101060]
MLNKRDEQRSRILIMESRLLLGICDPRGILRQGECYVRVTMDVDGQPQTLKNAEVLVTRNPCLHPGDLQKFKTVHYPELSHLVDCIVFPTQGKRPSADMMSGGDLDGDKCKEIPYPCILNFLTFAVVFVCWDPDLVPSTVSEPAEYPAAKEHVTFKAVTEEDRIEFFARYSNASLGRVKNLFLDWARLKGPMSAECQQLNRLFSQCVDGNRIRVPPQLEDPPKPGPDQPEFVLDILHESGTQIIKNRIDFSENTYSFDDMQFLLSKNHVAMSEFELILIALRWCAANDYDFVDLLPYFDFNSLSDEQKAWTLGKVPPTMESSCLVMNAMLQSNLVDSQELSQFKLHYPGLRWKRVFDSSRDRMGSFMSATNQILELFHKKMIILKVDQRLTVALYIPNKIEKRTESVVDSSVRVFALPRSQGSDSAQYRVVPTKKNYRVYCDDTTFQLYNDKRADTWIFLNRAAADRSSYQNIPSRGDQRRQKQQTIDAGINHEFVASIALNKISEPIRRHVGRLNRAGIQAAVCILIG